MNLSADMRSKAMSFLLMLETFTLIFSLRLLSKFIGLSTVNCQLQAVSYNTSVTHDMVTGLRDLLIT